MKAQRLGSLAGPVITAALAATLALFAPTPELPAQGTQTPTGPQPGEQGSQQDPQDPQDPKQEPEPESLAPADVAAALAVDLGELGTKLEVQEPANIAEALGGWLDLLEEQQAAVRTAAAAPEESDERKQLEAAIRDRDELLARVQVVVQALVAKAGEDEALLQQLAATRIQIAAFGVWIPEKIANAVDVDVELEKNVASLGPQRLGELLRGWLALMERQQTAVEAAKEAPEGSEERQKLEALSTDRDALVARAEVVIDALVKRGTDDDEFRRLVDDSRGQIAGLREAESEEMLVKSTVPEDQRKAQELPVEVLKAQLRPLTKAQVEEELQKWLGLLQRKALEIRSVEVASMTSEVDEELDRYNERAVALRAERDGLLRRVRTVIDSLERKGGDVEEPNAYVKSLVVTPPVTGVRAAWIQFRAWLVNPEGGLLVATNVGLFLAVLIAFRLLAALLAKIVNRAMRAMKKSSGLLREFFANTVRNVTMLVGLIVALGQLGVDIGPLLAAVGAAGFVIAFALQGTLSNFASGVLLMIFRPYDVGDVVIAGGVNGKVGGMNLMSTTIKTFDNQVIVVPNNKIWGDVITNVTAASERRVDMVFGIGYSDDIAKAETVLREIVEQHPKVLKSPEPTIQLHELGDSSVNFVVRPWSKTADYWDVYWGITRTVKERFDQEGISIPFPQRDVHVHQTSPATAASSA